MSKEERFELSCCLFNESDMDFIRDKKTNEEYVVLDELVLILNHQDQKIADLEAKLSLTEKALELAVADKCFAENCIAEKMLGKGAKVSVPKKEQWYLEQAKEMMKSE